MHESVRREIDAIRRDHSSGATALLLRGLDVMRRASNSGAEAARDTAIELWRAQPSMAGFRTAAAIVLGAQDPGSAVERLAQRVERTPAAIARHASTLLQLRGGSGPLRLVTCSRSTCVQETILSMMTRRPALSAEAAPEEGVIVACAEGRPALEGHGLAEALAARGVCVDLFSDAAVGVALRGADAFLIGADALTDGSLINKVGTGALACLAATVGVPVYVLAGSEKIVPPPIFSAMPRAGGPPEEIWTPVSAAIRVLNPYFEEVPLSAVAAVVTAGGVVAPDEVERASLWVGIEYELNMLI